MTQAMYLLGIDGGGTGCRARLSDLKGKILGEGTAGPANITLGLEITRGSILAATRAALDRAQLDETAMGAMCAGLGVAAANVPRHREALERANLPFASVTVRSDAEVACLGAHGGREGGILILGTGSQGVVFRDGTFTTVGGWGFALSDSGSGAILGRAAVRRSFLAHECVEPRSAMTLAIVERFLGDREVMLEWATSARPREWAEFAKTVFDYAEQGDPVALQLARGNTSAVERMLDRMIALGATRIVLMGGVAKPTTGYLSPRFDSVIAEPEGDAMDGALLLARRAVFQRVRTA